VFDRAALSLLRRLVVDPDAVPDADPDEGDETVGSDEVGTLSGSEPAAAMVPVVGPFAGTSV
jgi:hypothetical protein